MSDALGFTLKEISRLLRRRFDARARAIGVTRAQWHTLFVLSRNEGTSQGGLAEQMEVEPITACRMIDRLEEAGLVERRRDPADRRVRRIYLTNSARPLIDRLRVIADDVVESALTDIDQAERDQLDRTLAKIRNNLAPRESDIDETANG
ncbi:MarR family winged helix-turn-helix transcriptional regulator [Stakelama tenebrarum]|uniref:MarR family transcriptional regulator n=1 Tax=Stakelama tenebrarum TaxID=2711215 RepID=A0A6G6Y5G9_9SPHN|nr:MarR family transcriptional regulator [Sphingosinithalassobacter tenebrarum]QIG80047.1 MarR family transcriptional regulator [Sphingosinithalassobacter tenebrarum]